MVTYMYIILCIVACVYYARLLHTVRMLIVMCIIIAIKVCDEIA